MALKTLYRLALILPLVAPGLGALRSPYYFVGTVVWLYPDEFLRILVLLTPLAAWLWAQLGRRPATRRTALLWWAPLQPVMVRLAGHPGNAPGVRNAPQGSRAEQQSSKLAGWRIKECLQTASRRLLRT